MKEKEILDSWKEISEYLDKDIRTCHRWEHELGLPVHRYNTESSRSKVFAYRAEIDEWLQKKAEKFKKKKLLTLSLIIFMIIPFQGSGGISTPILARLLGVKAKKTVMIVLVGSTITTTLFTLSWLGALNFLEGIF